MTCIASCAQCGRPFCAHTEHPVAPDHDNETGGHCPGSNHEALIGVS